MNLTALTRKIVVSQPVPASGTMLVVIDCTRLFVKCHALFNCCERNLHSENSEKLTTWNSWTQTIDILAVLYMMFVTMAIYLLILIIIWCRILPRYYAINYRSSFHIVEMMMVVPCWKGSVLVSHTFLPRRGVTSPTRSLLFRLLYTHCP